LDKAVVEHVKGLVFSAVVTGLLAMSGASLVPARAEPVFTSTVPNNTPLSFGMDARQVSLVLGVPLNYVSGRPGNELYLAFPNVKGAALSDRKDGLYLQFRRGRLEGWKGDWASSWRCCN
jgi:hypothetical protein